MQFKAIAMRQPYAGFIGMGDAKIETRWKDTDYRGEILICSSNLPLVEFHSLNAKEEFLKLFSTGCAVCIANLVDVHPFKPEDMESCTEKAFSDFMGDEFDPNIYDGYDGYSYVFENPRILVYDIPLRTQRGIYDIEIDDDLLDRFVIITPDGSTKVIDRDGKELPDD